MRYAVIVALLCSFLFSADSLDALVEKVKGENREQIKEDTERKARFLKDLEAAKKRVSDIKAAIVKEKATTEALKTRFNTNKKRLQEQNAELERRSASLQDLFSIAQQESRDLSSMVKTSMTSVEYPDQNA